MYSFTLSNTLLTLLVALLLIGFLIILNYVTQQSIAKKKQARANRIACLKVNREHRKVLLTDYFWSDYMRFAWIMLLLIFLIFLGPALDQLWSYALSIIAIIVMAFFLPFSIQSYKNFPSIAAAKLEKFENEVKAGITSEVSFKGDNIQVFSNDDDSFDTQPKIFSFPTNISKVTFPPFQTNAKKQPIINTRKLEFLILSREYFSICQTAATFNLLEPARAPEMKQCAELPGRAGECHEHYYSQMRNVEYDSASECIRIIYYDERDDVEFPCKKVNPDRKPAIKALQEKLRLTERQRLHKIVEHDKYEEIKSRRENSHEDLNPKEDEDDKNEDEKS